MASKEILTLPRIVPMQRTIATPLSSVTSKTEVRIQELISSPVEIGQSPSGKSIQVKLPEEDDAKSSSSLRKNTYRNDKRSRSEEQLNIRNKNLKKKIQVLNNDSSYSDVDANIIEVTVKKARHFNECGHLVNNFSNLRRSMSENVGLWEDFYVDESQQETHKCLNDKLKRFISIKPFGIDKSVTYRDHLLHGFMNVIKNPCNRRIKHFDISKYISESRIHRTENSNHTLMNYFGLKKRRRKISRSGFSRNFSNFREGFMNNVNKNKLLATTEAELRNLIDLDILAFTEKYQLNITTESLYDLREDLFSLFVKNLTNVSSVNNNNLKNDVKNILSNGGFTESQAVYLTDILTEHFEEEFTTHNNFEFNSSHIRSNAFVVLPNVTKTPTNYPLSNTSMENERYYNLNDIYDKDLNTNVDVYVNQISNVLKEWLSSWEIHQTPDNELRQTITNSLANDIVDRKKYLELNASSEVSDVSELEHLKYQIFKWVYKMDNIDMTLIEHANDLMNRIQNIPVPIFSLPRVKINAEIQPDQVEEVAPINKKLEFIEESNLGATFTKRLTSSAIACCEKVTCENNINKVSSDNISRRNCSLPEPTKRQQEQATTNTRRMSSPEKLNLKNKDFIKYPQKIRSNSELNKLQANSPIKLFQRSTNTDDISYYGGGNFSGGIQIPDDYDKNTQYTFLPHKSIEVQTFKYVDRDKINEQYDGYLQEWVRKIPMPENNDDEQMLAQKLRIKVYNDLQKVLSKLKANPDIIINRFLCEDILDDEIEKVLSNIPENPKLQSRKHFLKVKLIEKTIDTTELLKLSLAPPYKQKLIDSVKYSLPYVVENENQNLDVLKLYEELQILNIVEDFIICSHFQNKDQKMSEAYRKKLLKRTETFVEHLKTHHHKALNNIDTKSYLANILNTLKKVPLPTEKMIQEEADEILLGIEIEKWFTELSLIQNDDFVEQLHRRLLRNNLVKQIYAIEKYTDNIDSLNNELKNEISLFVKKIPLQEGASLKSNAMVENLIRRLKYRPKSVENDSKTVGTSGLNYDGFSRNIPLCSSYTECRISPHDTTEIKKLHRSVLSNESVQTVTPNAKTFKEVGDIELDPNRCISNASLEDREPYDESAYRRDAIVPQWYTLQESQQEYPQRNNSQIPNSQFFTHDLHNGSNLPNYRQHEHNSVAQQSIPRRFETEFVVPQKYFKRANSEFTDDCKTQSFQNQTNMPKRLIANRFPLSIRNQEDQEVNRKTCYHTTDQRFSDSHSPVESSTRRERLNRTPHRLYSQNELDRYEHILNHTPEMENINKNQRSPDINESHTFHKTDPNKTKQTIERRTTKNNDDNTNRTITLDYHPPFVMPSSYVPYGLSNKKGYTIGNNIDGRRHEEEFEENNEGELRCRCVEKLWKSKKRFCPFDDYDDYPMYLAPPYWYPFFY